MNEIRFWTEGIPVGHDAMQQLRNIASLPILAGHVAVMPDVHLGKGATVGSVIPTRSAIVPACVGVDIGCGMLAVETSLTAADLPESLASLRADIEGAVPVGFACHDKPVGTHGDGLEGIALYRRARAIWWKSATPSSKCCASRADRLPDGRPPETTLPNCWSTNIEEAAP